MDTMIGKLKVPEKEFIRLIKNLYITDYTIAHFDKSKRIYLRNGNIDVANGRIRMCTNNEELYSVLKQFADFIIKPKH